ncbi:MAG: hypothetical protein JSV01_10885 [Desulfobacterales bacterium]|jgi:hypothetical protein|nr:MAG: hypothetical protein JSV01_10885 [Desulfobacterales bacterium]
MCLLIAYADNWKGKWGKDCILTEERLYFVTIAKLMGVVMQARQSLMCSMPLEKFWTGSAV